MRPHIRPPLAARWSPRARGAAALAAALAAVAISALTGCIDLSSSRSDKSSSSIPCGPQPYFTVLPVPAATIDWVDVIGRLAAPSQTLPKGHTGAMLNTQNVPVVAPGDLQIDRIRRVRYLASEMRQGEEDYALFYSVCRDVSGHFGHMRTLDSSTFSLGASWNNCTTYQTSDETVESCENDAGGLAVTAGQPLGTVAGPAGMALDMGLVDRRVTYVWAAPQRHEGDFNHMVCPFEYYDDANRDVFFSKLRDAAHPDLPPAGTPRCGTLAVDVAGTAQGIWVEEGAAIVLANGQHRTITLANNPYRPQAELALSLGPEVLGAGTYRVPRKTSGRVNRVFDQITDATVHCYFGEGLTGLSAPQNTSWLIALDANGSLKIEKVTHADGATPCAADPSTWAFTGNAMTLVR